MSTPKKSGKPSNVELLAERKAIAALCEGLKYLDELEGNHAKVEFLAQTHKRATEMSRALDWLRGELASVRRSDETDQQAVARIIQEYSTNLDRVQLLIDERGKLVAGMRNHGTPPLDPSEAPQSTWVEAQNKYVPSIHTPIPPMPDPINPAVIIAPNKWEPVHTKAGHDNAHYPARGEPDSVEVQFRPADKGPPQSAVLGDLTPAYATWYLATFGPDAARVKYEGRIHELPVDLQGALE